jgi:hypothetical protein
MSWVLNAECRVLSASASASCKALLPFAHFPFRRSSSRCARARRGVRGAPPARPSRLLVAGITTSMGGSPCWGRGLGLGASKRTNST